MVEVYHLRNAIPMQEFRIGSLLARTDLSVRTVGRIMAINRQVYDDIPHVRKPGPSWRPTASLQGLPSARYWFIDGRMMDFALDGVKWWSLLMLDGYSRTIAGAVAPVEASWVALMVLYSLSPLWRPGDLISDSGGAFSNEFEAVCTRLEINHEPIESTKAKATRTSWRPISTSSGGSMTTSSR